MDSSISDPQRKFLSGVRMKKRSIHRNWMQVGSITNQESLLLLPYHSMLTHVEKLLEERKTQFQPKPNGPTTSEEFRESGAGDPL